jgi:hypothetical protein
MKSGVTRACRYEPDANPTYLDMAGSTGRDPRRRKPRDGAKVESGCRSSSASAGSAADQTFFR